MITDPSSTPVVPQDGMVITQSVTFVPGIYVLRKGVTIAADGVTLDGAGAVLIGATDWPSGVRVEGRRDVTIKNLGTLGYYHGIAVRNCRNIRIVGNRLKSSAELDIYVHALGFWDNTEQTHGAGIVMHNVEGGTISDNDLNHQQNGILAYGCRRVEISRNGASFCSGWGFYLHDCHECLIDDNRADFCARICHRSDGTVDVGAYSAALVMIHGSSRNRIVRNYLRSSGDGILLCGYPESCSVNPCCDNVFEQNDASYSLNVSFDATFSSGNIFRGNKANSSNYGFWLGYSWQNEVADNEINDNRVAGIAIEHGRDNVITDNVIKRNHSGILLWTDYYEEYIKFFPGSEGSNNYTIARNAIESNKDGIRSYTEERVREMLCYDYQITDNTIRNNHTGIRLQRVRDCEVRGNRMVNNYGSAIWLSKCRDIVAESNDFDGNRKDLIEDTGGKMQW